ncbi:MAG: N-acetylmuramoyl-L-alanine amidase [Clostridiales bacterium]|nr:N-acetylmuramoyl-L-alanine amidase [Clostridiales bacterium]
MRWIFFAAYKPRPWVPTVLMLALCVFLLGRITFRSQAASGPGALLSLQGKTVVLDAGHGGIDDGVIGVNGHNEKEINLQIALLLAEMLEDAGAQVILTRANDGAQKEGKLKDLQDRVELANGSGADIFVSIHCNSYAGNSRWRGAQAFYAKNDEAGRLLAVSIQNGLRAQLKNTSRKAAPHETAYILQHLTMPAAIAEVGFLSNYEEAQLLIKPEYQRQAAWAICLGIAGYFAS